MWIYIILLFSAKSVLRAWNENACIIKIVKNTNTPPRFLFSFLSAEKNLFVPCQLAFFHDTVCAERKESKTSLSRGRKRRRPFGFIIGTICFWMNVGLLMNGAERSRKPPAANFFIKAANFSHFVIKLLAEGKTRSKSSTMTTTRHEKINREDNSNLHHTVNQLYIVGWHLFVCLKDMI